MKYVVAIVVALWPALALPQTAAVSGHSLVDALVWGADLSVDWNVYPPEVRSDAQKYQERFQAYQSLRQPRRGSPDLMMADRATLRYERKLAAVTDDPKAPLLAAEFVERLKPCYEWEGMPDCPEREARFAEQYLATNPTGPFRDYLPLLAAHRWLCASEAYKLEEQPANEAQSRRAFDAALSRALRSSSLLIRAAAQELRARNRCFPAER